jgi:hypothetical protein
MSAKQWILQSIKDRLGFTFVIVIAGLATALVTESSLIATLVGIGVALVVAAAAVGRRDHQPDVDGQSERAPGESYTSLYRWSVDGKPDLVDTFTALDRIGFALRLESQSSDRVVLRGGSQLWTRLFGGYFVDPKRLPIQVELKAIDAVHGGKYTIELKVQDRFGIAIRDKALGERFALAAASIRNSVEVQLGESPGFEASCR